MKTFFLGCFHPDWLARTDVPLFVSRPSFYKNGVRRKTFPRAKGPWALDSGGFTELKRHGRWTVEPERYVEDVHVFQAEVGKLAWASQQDWMCEESQLARTGLKIADHQRLTIDNYLTLVDLAPKLPWTPVLQGWTFGQYDDHVRLYEKAGVDLTKLPVVGVGSVCRRQATISAGFLIQHLADLGIKVHGFGFKKEGLYFKPVRDALLSADSQAWSLEARYARGKQCAKGKHPQTQKCNTCLDWALEWREDLMEKLARDDERVEKAIRAERQRRS